jgi:hypothetical protein
VIDELTKADLNDFSKGISDVKVAYVPYFGHHIIDYRDSRNIWFDIS